jgi:collagenase-like PrtC family protease
VVLSTLALLEAESELKRLRAICDQDDYLVEANDMGAVNLLRVGPSSSATASTSTTTAPWRCSRATAASAGCCRWS